MMGKQPLARSAEELVHKYQQRASFPLMAQIELTRRCNLRCHHCYLELDRHGGLPTATNERVLDELADAGALFVVFTGGEFALRPDWLKLSKYARKRGFALRLMTNGTLFSLADIEAIADLPVLAVHVSLYAEGAPHDAVTGVPGSFEKTLRTIERLHESGTKVIANIPVLETTVDELPRTIRLARSLGCELSVDTRICRSLDGERDNSSLVPQESSVMKAVACALDGCAPVFQKSSEISKSKRNWPCLDVETGLYVRADGEVWRCPMLPRSYGSVGEIPIGTLWRTSEERKALLRSAHDSLPQTCQHCAIDWACSRCAGHAMMEHGSLDLPASIDCRLARGRVGGEFNLDSLSNDTSGAR